MAGSGPGPESVAGRGGWDRPAVPGPARPGILRRLGLDREGGWGGGFGGISGRRVLGGGDEEGESGEGREVRWEGKAGVGRDAVVQGAGTGVGGS